MIVPLPSRGKLKKRPAPQGQFRDYHERHEDLFAINYSFQEPVEAANLTSSAPLPEADAEKIVYGNAEKIFRTARV